MSLLPLAVLVLLVLAVVAVAATTLAAVRTARATEDLAASRGLDGRRGLLRLTGAAAGSAAALWLVLEDSLGRGLLLAAPVVGLGLLLGVLAAELVVRPPTGPRRSASTTARRVTDYLPARLTAAVVATGTSLAVLAAVTTALASPDDLGRAGRSLSRTCSAVQTATRGPWPGSYYTAPLAVLVVVGVLLALLVLRSAVARPPLPARSTQAEAARLQHLDDELRARSARAVVAAVGVLLALPLVGVAGLTAMGLAGMVGCAPAWWGWVATAVAVLGGAAAVVLLWCASVVLLGDRAATPPDVTASR